MVGKHLQVYSALAFCTNAGSAVVGSEEPALPAVPAATPAINGELGPLFISPPPIEPGPPPP